MSNLDPKELNHFAALKDQWWDPNGDLKTLHQLNGTRLQFITDRYPLSGKKILDIGCGGGILSEELAKHGARVTGIDAEVGAIATAKDHAQQTGLEIQYLHCEIERFSPEHQGKFDAIVAMELLEHVPDPYHFLQQSLICLKPQGHFFISTVNRNIKAYLGAILGAEYLLQLIPKGTHDYKKFIKPSELSQWLRILNCENLILQGMNYNPFSGKSYLSKNLDINYFVSGQLGP